MIKKWKLISSEDVSPSKWVPLAKQKVELPNGVIVDDYYVIGPWRVAMVMPITANNTIVFIRQYKQGAGEITTEFPAGFIEDNETPEEAAKRELREETGYQADTLIYLGEIANETTKIDKTNHSFIATNLESRGKQNLDSQEDIELVEVPINKLDEFIVSGENLIPAETLAHITVARATNPSLFE